MIYQCPKCLKNSNPIKLKATHIKDGPKPTTIVTTLLVCPFCRHKTSVLSTIEWSSAIDNLS